jgi:predicted Zn-dependent protease
MLALWLFASLLLGTGCHSKLFSGDRSSLLTIPERQERQLGIEMYRKLLHSPSLTLSYDGAHIDLVNKTASKLIKAAKQTPYASKAGSYEWETLVVTDSGSRAVVVLPGGKIIVWSGLLSLFPSEQDLAPVLSHAMAHALGGHGAERIGGSLLGAVDSDMAGLVIQKREAKTTRPAMAALGFGPWLGVEWPYSDEHEAEADRIALLLTTRAGYDPGYGARAWIMLGKDGTEWASLHPWSSGRAELWAAEMSAAERFNVSGEDTAFATPPLEP